ncbi:LysR family transcriptional regulator [Halomonas icarae]|uniref:LysR family transcriptional regulator n=1 Tax=Halomonas icarae TaxID=2691040 RepID=A0A7X5AM99_9GAMM|nr:LysR family transcriptional regulator [Halomonas icarae]MDR5903358.1 LysR family transcriptional regulator [Halomonas icarae]NAW14282.1 LysR family transcriptional regulator [Halomonas icarae]
MPLPDLNLIRVFVLLYETASVTSTAERLNVTQPSISYALARLRQQFDDRLFIRARHGMTPTMTARQLYPPLRDALGQLEATLGSMQEFDPASCSQRFRLALTDLGAMALLPAIYQRLQKQAPCIELEVIPLEIDRVEEWLLSSKVNAVICSRPIMTENLEQCVILRDRYVCLGRTELLGPKPISLKKFLAIRHALVASSSGHSLAEDVMRRNGYQRKVSLEVPHFSVLPRLLLASDLLAIVPMQIAKEFIHDSKLDYHELPFSVPEFDVTLYWHAGYSRSPAQRWFCETIMNAIKEI